MSGPYVTVDQLAAVLGPAMDPDRAAAAIDAASQHVDAVRGVPTDLPYPGGIVIATLTAAARYYHDPDMPYGVVAGMSDVPLYAKASIPDVDSLLLGLRVSFGIA